LDSPVTNITYGRHKQKGLNLLFLCVLQLETALATLVTTWFTLADRRWRSRYRSSDQCILNAFRSPRVAIRRRKCPTIQQKNEWTQKWPYKKDALARE
jgi:hypothetical protein